MARKFFVEGPNKGREFIRVAHPEDTRSVERRNFLKRRQNSMLRGVHCGPWNATAARCKSQLRDARISTVPARIPKEVAADKTGLTSIETASSYSVGRLVFGRVSLPQRASPASTAFVVSSRHRHHHHHRASSLPVALTRTFAVRRSTRAIIVTNAARPIAIHGAAPPVVAPSLSRNASSLANRFFLKAHDEIDPCDIIAIGEGNAEWRTLYLQTRW